MSAEPSSQPDTVDAVIVGAGFAGMYMLHTLRGMGLRTRVFERGDGVGGTWYWNRYPGARCDVESMEYSYGFDPDLQQDWQWTERYAAQPEILRYANHVADHLDLRRDIQFDTAVTAAHFDDISATWLVTTNNGNKVRARFCIMATGCLSSANLPDYPGLDDFQGAWYHTGQWPHEGVDFTGKRVAVIGTGSSAIQSIPRIAEQAEHLTVFQRTANFSVPAHNTDLDPTRVAEIKANYADFRARNNLEPAGFGADAPKNHQSVQDASEAEREAQFEQAWAYGGFSFLASYDDMALSHDNNAPAAEFVRRKIRATVKDPATAELLCPDQVIGCKRLCVDIGYFETYNRTNVNLVDIRSVPIATLTADGLRTSAQDYSFDIIVFATGFDAMTGSLLRMDIRGRQGLPLAKKWTAGPVNYLGLNVQGFPNLFTISGPGSPSVLTNMVVSIEQHVRWIARCISDLAKLGAASIEAEPEAEATWVQHVNTLADSTLYPSCNSWYLGANIPGKPRVFMPHIGFPTYVDVCEQVVADGYRGFRLASADGSTISASGDTIRASAAPAIDDNPDHPAGAMP